MIGPEDLILIDTNVLVEVLRNKDKGRRIAETYLSKRAERPLISMISVGEVLAIARRQVYGEAKITKLNKLLSELVIVKTSRPVAEYYARLQSTLQKLGTPIGENDTWIAATAAATKSVLLTGDRDFEKIPQGLIRLEIVKW